MNIRAKGNRIRRKCINLLESEGWLVDVVEKTSRFAKEKDLYGIGDVLCLKPPGIVMIAQVTTSNPHIMKPYKEFKKKFPAILVRQYVWSDYRGFTVYDYKGDGTYDRTKIETKKRN